MTIVSNPSPEPATTILSVSQAIDCLSNDKLMGDLRPRVSSKRGDTNFGLWFRGHEKTDYKLIPSILRESIGQNGRYVDEVSLTRHFKALNPDAATSDASDFEWLVTMQHYLAPTRLLDWTENLLVALYFAVRNPSFDDKEDAAVWILNARRLNSYTSGTTRMEEMAVSRRSGCHCSELSVPCARSSRVARRLLARVATPSRGSCRLPAQTNRGFDQFCPGNWRICKRHRAATFGFAQITGDKRATHQSL